MAASEFHGSEWSPEIFLIKVAFGKKSGKLRAKKLTELIHKSQEHPLKLSFRLVLDFSIILSWVRSIRGQNSIV